MLHNTTMSIYRKKSSNSSPISLNMAKSFLRVKSNRDDELINHLISMATEYAEWYTEKSLEIHQWKITYIGYLPKKIYLPFGPINKIISIDTQVSNDQVDYKTSSTQTYIDFYSSKNNFSNLEITYEAGYGKKCVPSQITQGILHHVALAYKNREAEIVSNLSFIKELYSPFCELKVVL